MTISLSVDHALLCRAALTSNISWHAHPAFRPQVLPPPSPIITMHPGVFGVHLTDVTSLFLPAKTPDLLCTCFRFQPDVLAHRE